MQVSSVSNQGFNGKNDNINRFISMDDSDIKRYAIFKATQNNEKRIKRVDRLYYSIPLIAAASAAVLTKGNTKLLGNELAGKAAKLAEGLKIGGNWAFLLGTAAVGAAVNNKLDKKSKGYHNFRQNHPVLSFTFDLAAFLAAVRFIPQACSGLYKQLGPKSVETINKGINNIANRVNSLKKPKFVKSLGETISKIIPNSVKNWKASAVMPEALKSTAKTIVKYAPHITLLSAFFASLKNRARFMNDVDATYSQVRDKQQALLRARLAELEA